MQLKNQKGFTLIEIMVVMAVIVVMAAIALPNMRSWLPNMRLKAASRDLYGAAMLAKGEAVRGNGNCALTFGQPIGGTTYVYVVFRDTNQNFVFDAGEPVLRQVQQLPRGVALGNVSFAANTSGYPTLAFRSTSIPVATGGLLPSGGAALTNVNGRILTVVANISGNISIQNQ